MALQQQEKLQMHLERGPYLGEVSALCFLHRIPNEKDDACSPPFPFLLAGSFFLSTDSALLHKNSSNNNTNRVILIIIIHIVITHCYCYGTGTGSEILLYGLPAGTKIASFQVFDGIRVHGITSRYPHHHHHSHLYSAAASASSASTSYTVAVFGERRVKLYNLRIDNNSIDYNNTSDNLELTLLHSLPKFTQWVLDVCFFQVFFSYHLLPFAFLFLPLLLNDNHPYAQLN